LRLKTLKKLRTASLNSEFTGSYKKSVLRAWPWQHENASIQAFLSVYLVVKSACVHYDYRQL